MKHWAEARDNPDQLLEAPMASIEGLWRRMAYSNPEKMKENHPDPKIILRMLNPDPEKKSVEIK